MFLKKITLRDFRQFKGTQEISFSQEADKNVTILIGDNASGKTTFSQAFTWCLYGETLFSDKILLCKSTAIDMMPGQETMVSVILEFTHNGIEYKCTRRQAYTKDLFGGLKFNPSQQFLEYKDKDGQQKFIEENMLVSEVSKILPKELSRYFFFDGERINVMSKEIAANKSKDFSEAVRNLLGLPAFESALNHLNGPHNMNSVIRSYKKSFDTTGNSAFGKLKDELEILDSTREQTINRLNDIDTKDLPIVREQKTKLENEQREIAAEKSNIELRDRLKTDLSKTQERRKMHVAELLNSFSDSCYNFFLRKPINEVMDVLSKTDIKDKGIPDIHERTIRYLISKKKCICGSSIENGSIGHKNLIDLLQYIPPQSLGASIREFVNISKEKTKSDSFYENFETLYSLIHDCDDDILQKQSEISKLNEQLENSSEAKIAQKERELKIWQKKETDLLIEKGQCTEQIDNLTAEINSKNQKLTNYSNLSKDNAKISLYVKYAQYIYDSLKKQYDEEESKIREKFEFTTNQIFKEIYNGGLSLKIDERYNIKIIAHDASDYNEDVETSTSQSFSVILAFISAVIKMARDNQSGGNKLLVTEPYPLVMDAPLSSFDDKRIEAICNVLPNIAEQLIIFSNGKDGKIAETNFSSKIGKRFKFNKINEFVTYTEEV